ncbi:replication initiator protein A [Acidithiobacillus thiooxidans]|jgi:plasmid replication initiation protein|uniref:replication initiator protein A n=1 Tax=Acidithiobacillus thiooxidans TaxID=930 RepID=UPI00242ADF6A|nr:replication initiator protein A [Acidithiobacillus thiooxidans]
MIDDVPEKEDSAFALESQCIEDPGLRTALERARAAYIERQTADQEKKTPSNLAASPLAEEAAQQLDFFSLDLIDYAFKDDPASMEAPLYSLSTKKDTSTWRWQSEDGNKKVEVTCNAEYGRATQHDKDILIYCMSQLTAAINAGLDVSRTVQFTARDFLLSTRRKDYGDDYDRLRDALNRLSGTRISTNVKTGGKISKHAEGFGIIDRWRVIEKSNTSGRMVAIEVTLSEWLWNGITAFEVLTIHPNYFKLRKPLERRLYEIARKHVGRQGVWIINLEALYRKSGSRSVLRNFKVDLNKIIATDSIPEYRYFIDDKDKVTVYAKDSKRISKILQTDG